MVSRTLLSPAKKTEWGTPQWLFDSLNKKFNFTLDPCASDQNHKCKKYYTIKDDGLFHCWKDERVFMNPPYGPECGDWIGKACDSNHMWGTLVVGLLPVRTDTKWFQYILACKNYHIQFLKGRLRFEGAKSSAPFPSMIVYWL